MRKSLIPSLTIKNSPGRAALLARQEMRQSPMKLGEQRRVTGETTNITPGQLITKRTTNTEPPKITDKKTMPRGGMTSSGSKKDRKEETDKGRLLNLVEAGKDEAVSAIVQTPSTRPL